MKKLAYFLTLAFVMVLSTVSMAASLGFNIPEILLFGGGSATLAGTMTVTDLKSAFGTYVSKNDKKIFHLLTQPTVSQKYMSTIASAVTEYRSAKATIGNVVQGFTTTYNDKGAMEFTPRTIKNYRHKINVSITPDEVYESWVGWLVDNDKQPKDRDIIDYAIKELIMPKVLDDRENLLIGKGDYDSGNLDVAGKSMNGFVTILEDAKTAGTSNINFISLDDITSTNVVTQIEAFADEIDLLYQSIKMNVFVDPSIYKMYKRRYRDLYGDHVNFDDNNLIDYSNLNLVPLPSMSGTGVMFATPKENFIRLINRNEGATNFWTEQDGYTVKVYADWWEGVGFGIDEAVFAYIPEEASASGSASASASASGSGV
jgi:uncharacterized protein YciU (UPF0263 family)